MSVIYQVFQQLRDLNVTQNRQREVRAVFVAQTLAYQASLDLSTDAASNCDAQRTPFREFLSQLNEYIGVDTTLCQRLFEAMLTARWEVATCHHDPALMTHILASETQAAHLSSDLNDILSAVIRQREYTATQQRVSAILTQGAPAPE